MDDSEVCGRAADTSMSMTEFRTCVRDTGLVQLPATGCPYTWHNCSEGQEACGKGWTECLLIRHGWMLGLAPHTFVRYRVHRTIHLLFLPA
ncbi:UNVERIFIED_CONTAM: hypothetical protein Sangu_3204300 [Sesamum angustifolium]|uniref:Uncharacterized protein n=1 Tax=Sesamum angustifolium TaxID=2727405 RepID=A0AAW2JN93_9LAMI